MSIKIPNPYGFLCKISKQKLDESLISIFKEYQIVEFYLKWIYSYMRQGNPDKNYRHVKDKPLGNVISLLKKLDYSDYDLWISKDDYSYLKMMTEIRNHYIHRFFIDYLNAEYHNDYKECSDLYDQLIKDKNEIVKMRENIVKFYEQIVKKSNE